MFKRKKPAEALNEQEMRAKAEYYCAYRDRSEKEVVDYLYGLKASRQQIEQIVDQLLEVGFIDDKRFAIAFARGKFNSNHWGKVRIIIGLKQNGISESIIKEALAEIDPTDYQATLEKLINRFRSEDSTYTDKQKLAQKMQRKGYEADLIWQTIQSLENPEK